MKCMCLNFWNHWRGQHHHARLRFYIYFFLLFWLLSLLLLLFVRSLVWSLDKRKFVVQRTYVAIARPDFAPKWTEVLSGKCSFPCKCVMFFGRKWQNVSFFAVGRSFRFLLLRFAVKKWLLFFFMVTLYAFGCWMREQVRIEFKSLECWITSVRASILWPLKHTNHTYNVHCITESLLCGSNCARMCGNSFILCVCACVV